jgi:hypothetical protein
MSHLTPDQLDALRESLQAEHATLATDLAQHGSKEANGIWDPNSSGLDGEEADHTDAADQIEELVTNVPIVHDLASRSHDIDDALARMTTIDWSPILLLAPALRMHNSSCNFFHFSLI